MPDASAENRSQANRQGNTGRDDSPIRGADPVRDVNLVRDSNLVRDAALLADAVREAGALALSMFRTELRIWSGIMVAILLEFVLQRFEGALKPG